MSLINDALKKAQKMRHEENLAAARHSAGGGDAQQGGGRSRLSPGMIALISGGTALLVCAIVLTGLVFLRGGRSAATDAPEPVQAAARPTAAPLAEARDAQPPAAAQPFTQAAGAPKPTAVDNGPLIALPSSVAAKPAAPEPAPAQASAPVPSAPVASQEKPAASQAAPVFVFTQPEPDHSRPNPASQRFVDRIRITGVRRTSSGAKVMINEKVYRINDVVDQTLGLRLTEAESDRLVFTDEYGHRYVRNFLP